MFQKFILGITKRLRNKFGPKIDDKNKDFFISDVNKIDRDFGIFDKLITFYIERNVDALLEKILQKFQKLNLQLKIGIEIEFCLKNCDDNDEFFLKVKEFCKANDIQIGNIETERGQNQYEIKFLPYTDVKKLINDFNCLKSYLLNNFYANFDLIYDYKQPFNALQTNISLWNKNDNLFAKNSDEESELLIHSINGLLDNTNKFLNFYVKNDFECVRFDLNINEILQDAGFVPAPVFLSWGVNNRTASVRVPVPKDLSDLHNYHNVDKIERRIEYRVPSANADIKFVLYCNLVSIYDGIINKKNDFKKNNYNIIKSPSFLKKIQKEEIKSSSYSEWIF